MPPAYLAPPHRPLRWVPPTEWEIAQLRNLHACMWARVCLLRLHVCVAHIHISRGPKNLHWRTLMSHAASHPPGGAGPACAFNHVRRGGRGHGLAPSRCARQHFGRLRGNLPQRRVQRQQHGVHGAPSGRQRRYTAVGTGMRKAETLGHLRLCRRRARGQGAASHQQLAPAALTDAGPRALCVPSVAAACVPGRGACQQDGRINQLDHWQSNR